MHDLERVESQLRRAYFAHACEVAIRYGVRFERVFDHLCDAQAFHSRPVLPARCYFDDLVHVVACLDGHEQAWRDLAEHHERALVRACRQWLDPDGSIVYVRRLLLGLRRDDGTGGKTLRAYAATCSLRRWLGDRLIGGLHDLGGDADLPPPPSDRDLPAGQVSGGAVLWRLAPAGTDHGF